MGVTGLWTVVQPTARPTKLETLQSKRLAIDASIWIYQFLKAVRDKEGNALRNSHVVGFFRRICKLLYFGVKPVFVFDGGAPALKRETIRTRARRREGKREDAARVAGKLLAVQVAREAELEAQRQREARERPIEEEELPDEKDLVYVDEIGASKEEKAAGRVFRKKDQYHLPDLQGSLENMGGPDDPRVMSAAELAEYAQTFHDGEDINVYDFSKIDFDSAFFTSLPAGDKYNILNAARLRSRLRMGYSKDQLDGMFPDRMAFSRFQIERVKERNELTQRLMHVNGMNEGEWDQGGRIAGERGKEYVLVKHDGVEGGWALGVVSNNKGSRKDDAIDVDHVPTSDIEPEGSEEEFEDVAVEGLNRIPQSWKRKRKELHEVDYDVSYEDAAERIARKRREVYDQRKAQAEARSIQAQQPVREPVQTSASVDDGMFIGGDVNGVDDGFEDVLAPEENDDELQRAIAMSLEQPEDNDMMKDENPVATSANMDDDFDLSAALAESRQSKYMSKTNVRSPPPQNIGSFGGPLPFESLNLGRSLFSKKKKPEPEQGGFDLEDNTTTPKAKAAPVPDWFNAAPTTEDMRPVEINDEDHGSDDHITYGREDRDRRAILNRHPTGEVVDVLSRNQTREVIDVDDDEPATPRPGLYQDEEWNREDNEEQAQRRAEAEKVEMENLAAQDARNKLLEEETEKRYELARQIAAENADDEADNVVEEVRANPPAVEQKEDPIQQSEPEANKPYTNALEADDDLFFNDDDDVAWSESDDEAGAGLKAKPVNITSSPPLPAVIQADSEDDFEDVVAPKPTRPLKVNITSSANPQLKPEVSQLDDSIFLPDDDPADVANADPNDLNPSEPQAPIDFIDDDSDEELMRQLAIEAEEHDRFAAQLASRPKSPTTAQREYEAELKNLKNLQKTSRRDADEVTQTMISDCQALLSLFGLPYITAPMEAEAQCAELVHLGLVDGIVTDDSDIFLFGGTRIYKNMFSTAKFVECYLAADLEKEYALDRRKLIRFAHLLGSDYTEGIPGIGPVTALEIISDFADLTQFHEWTRAVQLGSQLPSALEQQLTTPFRRKFKKTVQKKLFLPNTFPDLRVDEAYLHPEVDSNPEAFQWGVPDLDKLRRYLMATIGWTQERTDEVLVPVVRDMASRDRIGVQSNITRFFAGGVGFGGNAVINSNRNGSTVEGTAPRNRTGAESGRMKNAYARLRGVAAKEKRDKDLDLDMEDRAFAEENPLPEVEDDETGGAVGEINGDEDEGGTGAGSSNAGKVQKVSRKKAARPTKKNGTTTTRKTTGKRKKKRIDDDDSSDDLDD